MKARTRIAVAMTIALAPGGFVLGAVLLARMVRRRGRTVATKEKTT